MCVRPGGCGGDGVDDLSDAVEGRISADGHVCPTEIIIDGAHQSHDVQVSVLLGRFRCDSTCEEEEEEDVFVHTTSSF